MAKPVLNADKRKRNMEIAMKFGHLLHQRNKDEAALFEVNMDLNEHRLVIIAMGDSHSTRKCLSIVDGVTREHTIGEMVQELESVCVQLRNAKSLLAEKLARTTEEMNTFMQTHNIRDDILPYIMPIP